MGLQVPSWTNSERLAHIGLNNNEILSFPKRSQKDNGTSPRLSNARWRHTCFLINDYARKANQSRTGPLCVVLSSLQICVAQSIEEINGNYFLIATNTVIRILLGR